MFLYRITGECTLLLVLSRAIFQDTLYSFHKIHVNNNQIEWICQMFDSHLDSNNWKIMIFLHAQIIGSGLYILQSVQNTTICNYYGWII